MSVFFHWLPSDKIIIVLSDISCLYILSYISQVKDIYRGWANIENTELLTMPFSVKGTVEM